MLRAQRQLTEHPEEQGKLKFDLDLDDLSRCAACYNHKPQLNDHTESSSSEGSGPDSETSSCSSSELDFEELSTQDTFALFTVAPDPPVPESGPPGGDTTETLKRRANRRMISVRSDSVLLETPRVTSVLNLEVLPPRHTYDPHYTIRRCPTPTPPERTHPSPLEPAVPAQQSPVPSLSNAHWPQYVPLPPPLLHSAPRPRGQPVPSQSNAHWSQHVPLPPLLHSAPLPRRQPVPFVPHYSRTQVHYGPDAPEVAHGSGLGQSQQPLAPAQ